MKKYSDSVITSLFLGFLCALFSIFILIYALFDTSRNLDDVVDYFQRESTKYEEKIEILENQINVLASELYTTEKKHKEFVETHYFVNVTLTAYTARPQETNNDPTNTAIMDKPFPGRTVAVSRDLSYLLGKRSYIEGIGVRYVNDLMNKRFTKTIDILMPTVKMARQFGVKENVNVVLITEERE